VLRSGGRLVALGTSKKALHAPLAHQAALWSETHTVQVNCGGAIAWVVVWERTSAPVPERRPEEDGAKGKRSHPTAVVGSKEEARRMHAAAQAGGRGPGATQHATQQNHACATPSISASIAEVIIK
jgi:hypothetical protein